MAIVKKCTICGAEFPEETDWKTVWDHSRVCEEKDREKRLAFERLVEALKDCASAGMDISMHESVSEGFARAGDAFRDGDAIIITGFFGAKGEARDG